MKRKPFPKVKRKSPTIDNFGSIASILGLFVAIYALGKS